MNTKLMKRWLARSIALLLGVFSWSMLPPKSEGAPSLVQASIGSEIFGPSADVLDRAQTANFGSGSCQTGPGVCFAPATDDPYESVRCDQRRSRVRLAALQNLHSRTISKDGQYEVEFKGGLDAWMSSVLWHPETERFLALDPPSGRIYAVPFQGPIVEKKLSEELTAQSLRTSSGALLLATNGAESPPGSLHAAPRPRTTIWGLNDDLSFNDREIDLVLDEGGVVTLISVFDWTLIDQTIVTVAGREVRSNGVSNVDAGLFRIQLKNDRVESIEELLAIERPTLNYYTLGFSYLAETGGEAYFLTMETQPKLFSVGPHSFRELGAVQTAKVPTLVVPERLGENLTFEQAAYRVLSEVEQHALPIALQGADSGLYLTTRSPLLNGSVVWRHHRIDASTGHIGSTQRLPSTAGFLAASYHKDFLVLLEGTSVLHENVLSRRYSGLRILTQTALRESTNTTVPESSSGSSQATSIASSRRTRASSIESK